MTRKAATPRSTKRAVGYIRLSTMDQVQEGHGLDAQEAKITAYCAAHELELVEMFSDEGMSGTMRDRPGYMEMRQYVLDDGISHVVSARLDRLGRSLKDLLDLYDELENKGVAIVAIQEGLDTSTAVGRLMRNVLGSVAEFEAELVSERTKAGLDAARAKGIKLGRPSGIDASVRARILSLANDSGFGWSAIARKLNEDGVPTSRGGTKWHPSTVRAVVLGDDE